MKVANRVVVTGIGVVAPNGLGCAGFWRALVEGRSGVGPITRFDPVGLETRFAAQVDEEALDAGAGEGERIQPPPVRYALRAADEALRASGVLERSELPPWRRAVVVAGGCQDNVNGLLMGAIGEANPEAAGEPGALEAERVAGALAELALLDDHDAYAMERLGPLLAQRCGAGRLWTVATACAGGAQALCDAYRLVQRGCADWVLAGGVDALVTHQMMAGFGQLSALSRRNEDPAAASRPFDRERDGFVMGEGAAFLVLESREHAAARGAELLAELKGAGLSADAWRLTDPRPDGRGMVLAMERALADAGMAPEALDYINAHGTSTRTNDATESAAIRRVFGAGAPPVSSTKSMTGHLIHGAGALEAAVAVLALQHQQIPPTINYAVPDPDCDLDCVPNQARDAVLGAVLSNSFGFGGQNTSLAFALA